MSISNLEQQIIKFQPEADIKIVADAFGNPDNDPVLLLHGGGQTRNSWKRTGKILAEAGWYVIATDARGHGESSWSKKEEYTFHYMTKDLIAIIKTLGKKPVLIGASMGGLSSLGALHQYPDLAKGLILVDVSPKIEKKGTERIFAFMSAKPDGYRSLREVQEAVKAYLPHRKNIGSLDGLKKNLRQLPNGNYSWHWDPKMLQIWKKQSNEVFGKKTESLLTKTLANLQIPTLLVRGGISDVVSIEIVKELRQAAPNLQFVDVADAGHMVAGDSNYIFTDALLNFLKQFD